jgi:hypothetical protein
MTVLLWVLCVLLGALGNRLQNVILESTHPYPHPLNGEYGPGTQSMLGEGRGGKLEKEKAEKGDNTRNWNYVKIIYGRVG